MKSSNFTNCIDKKREKKTKIIYRFNIMFVVYNCNYVCRKIVLIVLKNSA